MKSWILILGFVVPAADAQAPSFADLAKLPEVIDMELSPDGTLLAASVPIDSARQGIVVIDLNSNKPIASAKLRDARETFSDFMWVNDSYLLVSYASRDGGLAQPRPT